MERGLEKPAEVVLALTVELASASSGVQFVHHCLDELVAGWRLRDALVLFDEPPLGRQVFRSGRRPADGAWAGHIAAHARPDLYTDPLVVNRVGLASMFALCRLALRLDLGGPARRDGTPADSALELDLRELPGVVSAGLQRREGEVVVALTVGPRADVDRVRDRAEAAVNAQGQHLASITLTVLPDRSRGQHGRVQLLGVTVPGSEGTEVEVHVSLGPGRAVGRRAGPSRVEAVVDATLAAVGGLGLAVPFRRARAEELHPVGGDSVTVVAELAGDEGSATRYGIAAAGGLEQAAARATLDALNRHLALLP